MIWMEDHRLYRHSLTLNILLMRWLHRSWDFENDVRCDGGLLGTDYAVSRIYGFGEDSESGDGGSVTCLSVFRSVYEAAILIC